MSDDTTGVAPEDDAADAALLAELRVVAETVDPVPATAIAAARSAIAWRTMDTELAQLTADTSEEPRLAGVRGVASPAMLTFEASGVAVEIEVTDDGSSLRLLGQLVPPEAGEVEIRHGAGVARVAADEVGRFAASRIAPGPVSLRCVVGTKVVETDWFLA